MIATDDKVPCPVCLGMGGWMRDGQVTAQRDPDVMRCPYCHAEGAVHLPDWLHGSGYRYEGWT